MRTAHIALAALAAAALCSPADATPVQVSSWFKGFLSKTPPLAPQTLPKPLTLDEQHIAMNAHIQRQLNPSQYPDGTKFIQTHTGDVPFRYSVVVKPVSGPQEEHLLALRLTKKGNLRFAHSDVGRHLVHQEVRQPVTGAVLSRG